MTTKVLYSSDGEIFSYENIEDAIEELHENLSLAELRNYDEFSVYSHEFEIKPLSYFARNFLEFLSETVWEEGGDSDEDCLYFTPEQEDSFNEVVKDWLDKNSVKEYLIPVGRAQEIILSKEDLIHVVEEKE